MKGSVLPAGATVSHYRILSPLGAGGMGEVYLARDTKLERTVALKLLPVELASDPERTRRFIQEAQAASALTHPHICVIYETGESAEGRPFIAMEHVEGQTLEARIGGRPLETAEIVDIGIQAADALDAAHSRGIVHRDIKPGNIVITPRGQVKVLDFGLAKVAGAAGQTLESEFPTRARTDPGMVLGTVQYMSPEQALGRSVDHRTDVFSLGAVLYEMATGHLPFSGPSASETIDRIVHTEPPGVARFNYGLPPELERMIRKCLEKDPDRRYQSARDLVVDLKNLKRDSGPQAEAGGKAAPGGRKLGALVAAAVIAAVGLLGVRAYRAGEATTIDSIAVLPFVNAGADPDTEYLTEGLPDSLISSLSRLPNLKVISLTSVLRYKKQEIDPQAAGRDLGVRAILVGRVTQRGDGLMVSAELVDTRDKSRIWGEQYNRKLADIVTVQEDIAREIAEKLRRRLSGDPAQQLSRKRTDNPEAYQAYLKGRYYWFKRTEEGLKKGIEYFNEAIRKDPNYAAAYAGLADSYNLSARYGSIPPREAFAKGMAAALKALELDDSLAEAHASLGFVRLYYDWDLASAENEFKRAIELNPSYAIAHAWYALPLSAQGRHEEALREKKRAVELEPLTAIINSDLGRGFYYARDYDQAVEQMQKTLELDPDFAEAHLWLGKALQRKGLHAQAIAEFERAVALRGSSNDWGALGHGYAAAGRREEAQRVLEKMRQLSGGRYVASYDFAVIHLALGDLDRAFEWFQRAHTERNTLLIFVNVDPQFDPLRSDPRLVDLVRKMGLRPASPGAN